MKTLELYSCNNKFNKKPWLARLDLVNNELVYNFEKYDDFERLSGTRNKYIFELEEDVIYSKGDTVNYSNYDITNFIIYNNEEINLTKREAKEILKIGSYEKYKLNKKLNADLDSNKEKQEVIKI